MAQKFCIVGSANNDLFLYLDELPMKGETINCRGQLVVPGGKGANQAYACAKLQVPTIFAGQFGQDSAGDDLMKYLQNVQIDVSKVRKVSSQTGQAIIMVNKNAENSIVIVCGANADYPNLTILPQEYEQAIDECDFLLLQKEIPIEINALCASYGKNKGKLVMLDCGGRDDNIPDSMIYSLDFISPNETELIRLMNTKSEVSIETIQNEFIAKYPNIVVVLKQGEKGSAVITKDFTVHVGNATNLNKGITEKYEIIDTTGAGDCFTSAFCVKYLELIGGQTSTQGKSIEDMKKIYKESLIFANYSAFLCITVKGAMPSMPTRQSVDTLLGEFPPQ